MFQSTRLAICVAALTAIAVCSVASAQTWVEGTGGSGDAGQNGVAAAQPIVGTGGLSMIEGTLSIIEDVDIYAICISDAPNFWAFLGGSGEWPYLWLFNADGTLQTWTGADGNNIPITGATGFSNGVYYLGISNPVNGCLDSNGAPIYTYNLWPNALAEYQGNGGVLASWEYVSGGKDIGIGDYAIEIRGANFCIPAPSTLALLGLACLPALSRRRLVARSMPAA